MAQILTTLPGIVTVETYVTVKEEQHPHPVLQVVASVHVAQFLASLSATVILVLDAPIFKSSFLFFIN